MSGAKKSITKFRQRSGKIDQQLGEIQTKITELEQKKSQSIEASIENDSDLSTLELNDKLRILWDAENDLHTLRDVLDQKLRTAYEDRRGELLTKAERKKAAALQVLEKADTEVRALQLQVFQLQWRMADGWVGEAQPDVPQCTLENRGELFEAIAVADRQIDKIKGMSQNELSA